MLVSGQVLRAAVLDPHGTPADPCAADEIEAKFRRLTATVKTIDAAERIIAAARNLREAPSLDELSNALRDGNLKGDEAISPARKRPPGAA